MIFNDVISLYKNICKINKFFIKPFLYLNSGNSLNAINYIWKIEVFQGACNNYNTDEMALLLGHELAHLNFKDIFNIRKPWDKEFRADLIGAKYMLKAGYNLENALSKFDKMPQMSSNSHPHPQERKQRLIDYLKNNKI